MRKAKMERNTRETQVGITLNLDGTGQYANQTGVGF
ncbi:MAG: imidazoleglycerol-phosphate dehydratase, partial [Candidatus Micrarchaeota archaeon]|nr:imidazoleglycerol-phosphate dehydratase [Candidatus Micrarchaeota archaeon]